MEVWAVPTRRLFLFTGVKMDNHPVTDINPSEGELAVIKFFVSPQQYRAFQRCVWLQVHETGCSQLEVMEKMIDEILIRHAC